MFLDRGWGGLVPTFSPQGLTWGRGTFLLLIPPLQKLFALSADLVSNSGHRISEPGRNLGVV